MAFDQAGEQGLRRRLRLAVEDPTAYPTVAATLGISESTLRNYLDNPEYVLGSDLYAQIVANLPLLPIRRHHRADTHRWRIIFDEKPQWTRADIDALVPPFGASQVVMFVYDANYPDRIASAGPIDLDIFTVQQSIDAATNGDPNLLTTVVWYVPIAEYPYPAGA